MTSLKIGVIYLVEFLGCHREERNVVHRKVNDIKIYWLLRQRQAVLTVPVSPWGVLGGRGLPGDLPCVVCHSSCF